MEDKLGILTELVKMANTDGQLHENEYQLITAMAGMLGLNETYVEIVLKKEFDYQKPSSEFERIIQFHRLVLVANVDMNVDSLELDQLREAGLLMGLRPEAIERVLKEMTKHPNGMIPAEDMVQLFQTYHN